MLAICLWPNRRRRPYASFSWSISSDVGLGVYVHDKWKLPLHVCHHFSTFSMLSCVVLLHCSPEPLFFFSQTAGQAAPGAARLLLVGACWSGVIFIRYGGQGPAALGGSIFCLAPRIFGAASFPAALLAAWWAWLVHSSFLLWPFSFWYIFIFL